MIIMITIFSFKGQSRINGVAAVIPANSYRNLSTELKIAVQKLQGEINSDLKR